MPKPYSRECEVNFWHARPHYTILRNRSDSVQRARRATFIQNIKNVELQYYGTDCCIHFHVKVPDGTSRGGQAQDERSTYIER